MAKTTLEAITSTPKHDLVPGNERPPLVACNLLPWDSPKRMWATIEYFCGLRRGELVLKSSYNKIEVRDDMAKSFRRKRWVLLPTKSVIAAVVAMIVHNRGCHVTKRKRFTDFFTEPVPQYALIGNGSKAPKLHLWTKDGQHERCTEAPVIASSTMHPLFVICAALAAGMSFHLDHPSRKTLALLKVKSLLTSDLPPEFQVGEPAVQPFLLLRQLHPKREHDLLSSIGEALLFTGHEADFLHPDADSTDHDSEDSETTSETDEFDGSDLTAEEIASIEEWTRKCAEVTFEVLEDAPIGGYANEPCRGVRELLKLTDY